MPPEPSKPAGAALERLFERAFDARGAGRERRLAFAPGRVNLIGEHVDYCDLPVMPMAVQLGVSLLFRPRDDARVRLVNLDPSFAPRELELSPRIEPFPSGDWGNYAKAAGQALVRRLGPLRGFDGAVSSDLPSAAGLSSSAALVIVCALASCAANGVSLEPLELAQLLAEGERYVGTQGGGMDQAASLAGVEGCALHVRFAPLRVEALPVPHGWRFVVAHSGVRADKSGAAREAYNRRRAECEEAFRRVSADSAAGGARSWVEMVQARSAEELVAAAERVLDAGLLRRFRHVVTESERVRRARAALVAGDGRVFGEAMDASHASLRDDFEVSCAELDEL
ncbi:MAG TPA: galactokinase family protein, partial [Planctomycetota bacterium]|nr:galactokinase family protein [Planctomycetota bacterium]